MLIKISVAESPPPPLTLLVNFTITRGQKEIQTINSTPQVEKTVTPHPPPPEKETTNSNLTGQCKVCQN